MANDLPESRDLDETVALINRGGGQAYALAFDIADIAAHEAMVDTAWSAFGGLECLVNNAGVPAAIRGDILDVSPSSFDRVLGINLRGTFFLSQAVARRMVAHRTELYRSIVTISSISAEFASVDRGEYCISKIGLSMLTKLLATRLADHGIGAYEIRPGIIRTDMTAVVQDKYDRLIAGGLTPIRRWGEAEDIGRAVAMLATGALRYSTGEVIRVDGGMSLQRL